MKLYRFDADTAQAIMVYNSRDVSFTRAAGSIMDAHVGVMYIAAGGKVGEHQATGDQLFMVVGGSGWVAGQDHAHLEIKSGQAAFWQEGEWHEAGSVEGMSVVIVEGQEIEPILEEMQ